MTAADRDALVQAMREALADGRCICSSSATDWSAVETLLDLLASGVLHDADQVRAEALREAALRWLPFIADQRCPTCTGPIRETTGMVCQTCGTDYGGAS